HALLLEVLADLVVDDLGLVLGADAGEELALRLGDPEAVEGLLDVLGDLVPAAAVLLGRADEVVDVVPVDLAEVPAPRRRPPRLEVLPRLEPELAHPLRLVLVLGDRLDDLAREALRGLVRVARLGIAEAELLRVVGADLLQRLLLGLLWVRLRGVGRRHQLISQSISSFTSPSSIRASKVSTGTYAGSVLGLPVRTSNSEPWRGHSTVQASASNSPSASGPSSCEQRSSIAYSSPSVSRKTPILRPSASTMRIEPSGSSSAVHTFTVVVIPIAIVRVVTLILVRKS